jgi:hypothetical protein
MNAIAIIDFLEGRASAKVLNADLRDAWEQNGVSSFTLRMKDLNSDYRVGAAHLVKICDAVLAGDLQAESLEAIGFAMIASRHFQWDTETPEGEIVAETLHDWAAPGVNYRLDLGTIQKFRHRLLTRESTFNDEDIERPKTNRTTMWRSEDEPSPPA